MLTYLLIAAYVFSFIVVLFMCGFDWMYAKQIKKVEGHLSIMVHPFVKKLLTAYIGIKLTAAGIILLILLIHVSLL